ncbi:MAG: dienelactone hydrolase family protein [Myxococcales bacterium]|nr:dienelactone hydrolase family protein [Myxococcales bacterium]
MIPRVLLLSVLVACGSPTDPDVSVEQPGPHAVGTRRITTTIDASHSYTLQAWYPTTAATAEVAIESLEAEPLRTRYAGLLAAVGTCPTRKLDVAVDGEPEAGSFPLVVASHCHACTRFSNASTALRLASHGFVVVTVDHTADTMWDLLDGNEASLDSAQLALRVADLEIAIDVASPALVSADRTRLGVFGHSFGAVTAGRLAQLDDRVQAAAALAAPMENPLIPGVVLAEITQPLLFLVAREDNSITEFGNKLIRDNYTAATNAAWKLEIADAGHWSVSDLDGLIPTFAKGCGPGTRQDDGSAFTYLDPELGRSITASYVTAFFRATLEADEGARAYLARGFPDEIVSVAHHD